MPSQPQGNEEQRQASGSSLAAPPTAILLLVGFGALLYLPGLGAMPLWERDEPRYAEVAREMLESGDFVTPRFDYVRYAEKPPLLFWMTAGSFALLGQSDFAARLPSALAGIASALVCYLLARSMFGALAGLFAGAVLATSVLHCALARMVRFDGPLALFISLALLLFWLGHRESDPRRAARFYLGVYPVAALAMLTKGPVGPGLVALIIFLYLLATRNLRLLARMRVPLGLLLFAVIAGPWFVLAERANPGVSRFFFMAENMSRFTSGADRHEGPVWFYLPVLVVGMLPWVGLLPAVVGAALRERRAEVSSRRNAVAFCLIWAGVVLGFFSLSACKLELYVLPAWPALAVLIGNVLARFAGAPTTTSGPRWERTTSLAAVLVLAFAVGVGAIVFVRTAGAVPPMDAPGLTAGLLTATLFAGAVILVALRTRRLGVLLLVPLAVGGLMLALASVTTCVGIERSRQSLALQAKAALQPGDLLVAYVPFKRELCYYTQQRVIMVGNAPPEFHFDPEGARRDGPWLPERGRALALLHSGARVLAFATHEQYRELAAEHPHLFRLAECNGIVLFSNRPARHEAQ